MARGVPAILVAVLNQALVGALATYRGGLVVVSRDDSFLGRLRITTWLELDPAGRLSDGASSSS